MRINRYACILPIEFSMFINVPRVFVLYSIRSLLNESVRKKNNSLVDSITLAFHFGGNLGRKLDRSCAKSRVKKSQGIQLPRTMSEKNELNGSVRRWTEWKAMSDAKPVKSRTRERGGGGKGEAEGEKQFLKSQRTSVRKMEKLNWKLN